METRDRELTIDGGGGFSPHNRQSTSEFTKLLVETIFALRLAVDRHNGSTGSGLLKFSKYHTEDGRSVPCMSGLRNSFSLNWRLPAANSCEGFSLEATIWSGGPPALDYLGFEKPRPETSRALHLGYSVAKGYAWIGDDGADEFTPQALAEDLVAWYLDNGR
jgi:hypothetical protein